MEISIEYRDSLSDQNQDKDKYSLVLANPPFKGSLDAESVSGDLLKVCKTKKTELLFLTLFLRILKIGGRCACIVPDGVLFGSSKAHKDIRTEIVENQRLEAVISMPSGVFKPYAGVSTAILVFTKTEHGGTDNVWFYDMKADGFSLDDKRAVVSENDRTHCTPYWDRYGAQRVSEHPCKSGPFRPALLAGHAWLLRCPLCTQGRGTARNSHLWQRSARVLRAGVLRDLHVPVNAVFRDRMGNARNPGKLK